MSRFYRTTRATPLDYMHRLNIPLMEKVVATNDGYIDQNLQQADALSQLANYNYLEGDSEDAQKIIGDYRSQIDSITDAIRKDPANWRAQLDPIRKIKSNLQNDYTNGPIAKQIYNYNQRKTSFDQIDKQVELYNKTGGRDKSGNTVGIDPQRAALMKSYLDKQFTKTGYDPATNNYNVYKAGNFMSNIDVRKRLSEGFEKLKADGTIRVGEDLTKGGEYFNKVTQKWEGLTPQKILQLTTDRLQGDDGLMDYLRQDSQIGNIRGAFDEQGRFINPYSNEHVELSPEEQQGIDKIEHSISKTKDPAIKAHLQKQLDSIKSASANRTSLKWNDQSYLAPIMRGIVNEFSYSKTDTENDLTNNSLYNTKLNISATNQRDALNRGSRERIAGANLAYRAKHDKEVADALEKRFQTQEANKFKLKELAPGKAATGTTKALTNKDLPSESGLDAVATNSFEDWSTKDRVTGQRVPVLSNAGLSSDIDNFKRQLDSTTNRLNAVNTLLENKPNPSNPTEVNEYNKLLLEKQQLTFASKKIESDLGERRNFYKRSTEVALTDLTPDEKRTYEYIQKEKPQEKLKKKIEELTAKIADTAKVKSGELGSKTLQYNNGLVEEANKLRNELKHYTEVKNKVDKKRDDYLAELRKDHIDEDGIKLGQKDAADVSHILLSNPTGLQLYDNTGKSTAGIDLEGKGISWFNPKADNFKLSFADNSLADYITNSHTEIIPQSIAPTTALGNGNAVIKVQFNDPNGEIPKGKDYYIVATPEMQKQLGTKFKGHKNPDIAAVADNILDDLGNSIRRQIAKPNNATGSVNDGQKFVTFIPDNQGNQIPLNTVRIGNHYNVTFRNKNGEDVPLPSLSGKPGFFNGSSELIQSIKAVKAGTLK